MVETVNQNGKIKDFALTVGELHLGRHKTLKFLSALNQDIAARIIIK